jgi:ATP-dependent RNA helicase DDX3X
MPAACCLQVSGQDAPEGISSFEDVDLPPALMENVKRCKYTKPTPVQVIEAVVGRGGVGEGCSVGC